MWNITSLNVQRAKEELELRRDEIEARYAEEKQALDAEFAMIEALEHAAAEFILRQAQNSGAGAADPPGGAESGAAEAEPIDEVEQGGPESDAEAGAPPAGASGTGEPGEAGLDILKPGSRWRLYRSGIRSPDQPESLADKISPAG